MLKKLQHARVNALILGLVQGLPQGFWLSESSRFTNPALDQALPFLVGFGLLAPPLMFAPSLMMNRARHHRVWVNFMRYVNAFQMMFWGGVSLGLAGLYSIESRSLTGGYARCAFFISAGIGILVAGLLDKRLGAKPKAMSGRGDR